MKPYTIQTVFNKVAKHLPTQNLKKLGEEFNLEWKASYENL